MQVNLLKRKGTYKDKEGKDKQFTNYYLECGDSGLIPIEVSFFPDKDTGKDVRYSGRRQVLSAFADNLPEQTIDGDKVVKSAPAPNDGE